MERRNGIYQRLIMFFTSPVFHDDEVKTRLSRVLFYTSLVSLSASIILHVTLFLGPDTSWSTALASYIRIIGGLLIIILVRRGIVDQSAYVFVGVTWLSFAISTPLNGGVYSFGFRSGFLLLIFITSLLIGFRAATIVTVISILYGIILAQYFPSTEFLKIEFYRHPFRAWMINSSLFIIAIVFIRYSMFTIRESLQRARSEWKERLKTEKSFHESEQSYREVFNATNEAIIIIDPERNGLVDVNESAIRMYGYPSKEEILTRTFADLSENAGEFTTDRAKELVKRSLTGTPQVFEWHARKKKGELFWTEISLRSSSIGGATRILAVIRDITEKRKVETALHENEHRLKLLTESAFEGIVVTSAGVVVETNDQVLKMLECSRDELIGRRVDAFVAPQSKDFVASMIRAETEEPYEHVAVKKDGTEFWVEVRGKRSSLEGRNIRITVIRNIDIQKKQSFKIEHASRQLRNIIRSASRSAFITTNLDGIITAFNSGAELMLGYSVDDVVAVQTPMLFHLESEVRMRSDELSRRYGYSVTGFEVFVHNARNGFHEEREWTYVRKDGSHLTVSLVVTPMYDDEGILQGFLGVARDISDYKTVEGALKISEERFSTAFNNAPLLMTISSYDEGRFIEVNNRCFEYSGYHPQEIVGKTAIEIGWITAEDRAQIISLLNTNGHVVDLELDLRRKDGKRTHRLYNCETITINGKKCLLSISLNITDRKAAELMLSEKEEKYKRLFETAGDAILIMNEEEFVDCNMKSLELFRCTRDQLIGKRPYEFSPLVQPGGVPSKELAIQKIRAALGGQPQNFDWQHLRADGTIFDAEVTLNKIYLSPGMQIQAIVRDVSVRKKSEEQIRLLAHAMMSARESICIIDLDDSVLYVNNQFIMTYGYTEQELIGKDVTRIRSPFNTVRGTEMIRKNNYSEAWHGELMHRKKDGTDFPVHVSISAVRGPDGNPEALIGVITDLTEQKQSEEQKRKLEDQLIHAQKMESFGRLAGGIAHDFNNMLTPILGFGELLKKSFTESDPRVNKLQQIIHAAESSKSLVGKLLAFARKQNLEMKRMEINAIIAEFQKILSRTLREDIIVTTQLHGEPLVIEGDAGQIEQIILNLAVNAMDAMPHGGALKIATDKCVIADTMLLNGSDESIARGEYITLSVTDSGSGISLDVLNKIFDPFFTTKEKGKGTGLGLSTVYGIVKQHRGYILVDSTPGKGSVFTIYFPRFEGVIVPQNRELKKQERARHQKRTYLVVEDQEQILELIQEVLTDEGYTVYTASSVSEAKTIFDSEKDNIDALITDIILPDGNGRRLFEMLAKEKTGIKVLFMSSYTEDSLSERDYLLDNALFIPKPFDLSVFLDTVRQLDES
ncbi:MAG: PAS domain S-box protein [Bacteroidota bacterium]